MNEMVSNVLKSFELGRTAALNLISSLFQKIGAFLPKLIGAILILLLGWLIAILLRAISKKVFSVIGLNYLIEKSGINQIFKSINISKRAEDLLASLVYITVLLITVVSVAEVLGIKVILETLNLFIAYLPNIFGALFIFSFIVYLGKFIKEFLVNLTEKYQIQQGRIFGNIVEVLMIAFALVIALNKLGFDTTIITTNITLIITILLGAFGLAIALGGQKIAEKVLAGLYLKHIIDIGEIISIKEYQGQVLSIKATTTEIKIDNENRIYVPNDELLKEVILKRKK